MVGLDNPLHIALVLVVVLMVFGAKRLPEMGKGLGEGMRGFKHALSGEQHSQPEPRPQVTAAAADEEFPTATQTVTEREPVA
jgi:sec-independent protein translocase protein TatA